MSDSLYSDDCVCFDCATSRKDARITSLEAQLAAAQERFAEMWRVATEAAFSNQDDRCCFCNTRRGRLHEENCSLNAWQYNAAALAAAQQEGK